MARLVKPSIKYKKSFLEALQEFEKDKMRNHEPKVKDVPDFDALLKRWRDQEKGIGLGKGVVPDSHFWLVEGNKYIGKLAIRHKLNAALKKHGGHIGYAIRPSERNKGYGSLILKLGIKKAEKLGIKNALLTCDVVNTASRKIIEKNGGKLVKNDKVANPGDLRFWLKIGKIDRKSKQ